MEYFWWGYFGIAGICFVILLVANIKFLVEYFAIHYDAATKEFGCDNVLEEIVYVVFHSLATTISSLIIFAVKSLTWPWMLLKSVISQTLHARNARVNRA